MYNVLWVDDQHKDAEMIQFCIEAESEGFILEGYPSFEEAFDALERNIERFDLILLDGMFFEKKGQQIGTEDEIGIGMAIGKINELKSQKIFPWFVLSGKDQFTKGENTLLRANKAQSFDKTNPLDVVRLYKEMHIAAKNQADVQLKFKYRLLLDLCTDNYLGSHQYSRLISLIRHIENIDFLVNTEDMFNPIRKIIERVFTRFGEIEIIPRAIIENAGWINKSSLFLTNKHTGYKHNEEFIPPLVCENIYRLLNLIQDASHGDGGLRLRVDQYLKDTSSDYLYRSCLFLLFDLLLWFKDFIDKHDNIAINKTLWRCIVETEDWIHGSIIRIAENKWGTFQADYSNVTIGIIPKMMSENDLSENDRIKIITELSRDGTKKYVKLICKEI